jgi:hypothetical protein
MLHENPLMVDANVDHWRNLQALILQSAKGKRRIIVIHEDGEILKFVHSKKAQIVKPVDRIDDPNTAAKAIYDANPGACDFVAVFERRGFDRYVGAFQDTWRADEDLDVYVQRTYAMMDQYPAAIVTYPGPARDTLGLQWRLGATYEGGTPPSGNTSTGSPASLRRLRRRCAVGHLVLASCGPPCRCRDDGRPAEPRPPARTPSPPVVAWVEPRYGAARWIFTDLEGARVLAAADKGAAVRRSPPAARSSPIAFRRAKRDRGSLKPEPPARSPRDPPPRTTLTGRPHAAFAASAPVHLAPPGGRGSSHRECRMSTTTIPWSQMTWLNPPRAGESRGRVEGHPPDDRLLADDPLRLHSRRRPLPGRAPRRDGAIEVTFPGEFTGSSTRPGSLRGLPTCG